AWQDSPDGGRTRTGTDPIGVCYTEAINKDNTAFTRSATNTRGAPGGQVKTEHWINGVYDVTVRNARGWTIMEGREDPGTHTYTVKRWDDKSTLIATEVYDKPGPGQMLLRADRVVMNGTLRSHAEWNA